MIKYIIFDLAEVLLTGIKETGLALLEKHKLDSNEHPTPLLVPLVKEFFNGNVTEDEYIAEVLKAYPQLGEKEDLKNHIRENFIEVEGTRDIILKLKEKGYKLALLSVHSKEWIEYCDKKFDFHKLFDVISYSYEDKVSKPDVESFKLTLKKLHAKPEECLFIDDSETNTKSARTLGISTIVFTNAKDLEDKLVNLYLY